MTLPLKKPFDSEQLILILNRIIEMDEPYISAISDHLNKEIGALQKYTETMVEKGWIAKEKKGRKTVFEFNPRNVWMSYPKLRKLGKWQDLDDRLQEFLKFALRYKVIYAVSVTSAPEDTDRKGWTEATDIDLGTGEPIYLRPTATMGEILQENIDTVLTIEALLDQLGEDDKRATDTIYAHEKSYVEAYLKMMSRDWNEEDLKDFTEEVEENPFEYM